MMRRPVAIRFFQYVIVAVLAVIIIAEALLYAPPLQAKLTSSIEIQPSSGSSFAIAYSISSTFSAHVNVTATVSNSSSSFSALYFYYDSAYPSSFSEPVWSYGLSQHLPAVLAGRDLHPSIVVLDASQLLGFLTSRSTSHSVLFMGMGVIPDTVFNRTKNYLAPWIRSGGTLVWFGDTIGFYAGAANTPLQYPSSSNPGEAGVEQFVNETIFGPPSSLYLNQSLASRTYDYTYPYGLPNYGLLISTVEEEGGQVLGTVAGNVTNAARLPLGLGSIDYFAVPLTHDITQLSVALTNMLQGGALTGPFEPIADSPLFVRGGTTQRNTTIVSIPYLPWLSSSAELCVVIYQSDLLATYGNAVCETFNSSTTSSATYASIAGQRAGPSSTLLLSRPDCG